MWLAGWCWCAAKGVERYLRYFVALGAGFLMATLCWRWCLKG